MNKVDIKTVHAEDGKQLKEYLGIETVNPGLSIEKKYFYKLCGSDKSLYRWVPIGEFQSPIKFWIKDTSIPTALSVALQKGWRVLEFNSDTDLKDFMINMGYLYYKVPCEST